VIIGYLGLASPSIEGYSQSRVNSLESTQSIGAPK
jgi:hypothetical protein